MSRGGKREGAGRKSNMPWGEKRTFLGIRIDVKTRGLLRRLAKKFEVSDSQAVRQAIRTAAEVLL